MRIVCLSDTHCRLRKVKVPEGDLLIHAGDLTFKGNVEEISQELRELGRIAKNFKNGCVLTPGNHDWLFQKQWGLAHQMCKDEGIVLLHDSGIEIENKFIWGSAWQPEFYNWAYNLPRGEPLRQKWEQMPDNTDILITHGPPMGILDYVERFDKFTGEITIEHVGCADLYDKVNNYNLEKGLKNLKLHVFGHIHLGYGQKKIKDTLFVNASICTEQYKPTNQPIVVEL